MPITAAAATALSDETENGETAIGEVVITKLEISLPVNLDRCAVTE
jgi:hypothetical protein